MCSSDLLFAGLQGGQVRSGLDLDLDDRIPSDVICAAAAVEPAIGPFVGQYLGMVGTPKVLEPAEGRVRELLESGWRPALVGPTAADLTALVGAVGA